MGQISVAINRLAFFSREGAVTVSDIAIKNMPQDGIGEEEN